MDDEKGGHWMKDEMEENEPLMVDVGRPAAHGRLTLSAEETLGHVGGR